MTDAQRERAEDTLRKVSTLLSMPQHDLAIDAMLQFAAEQRSAGEAEAVKACEKICRDYANALDQYGDAVGRGKHYAALWCADEIAALAKGESAHAKVP